MLFFTGTKTGLVVTSARYLDLQNHLLIKAEFLYFFSEITLTPAFVAEGPIGQNISTSFYSQ